MIFWRLFSQGICRFDGVTSLFHLLSKNSKTLQDIPAEVRVKSSTSPISLFFVMSSGCCKMHSLLNITAGSAGQ